jgi:hypothetical protein
VAVEARGAPNRWLKHSAGGSGAWMAGYDVLSDR